MKLETAGEKENKIMHRRELLYKVVDSKVTPSRKELREKIAAMANAKQETVVIESIEHSFGERDSIVKVHVYDSVESLKKIVPKYLVTRDIGKKKAEAEAKPAEKKDAEEKQVKEEKPAAEKPAKKEKPAEEKKEADK